MSLSRFEHALLASGGGDRPSASRRAAARRAVMTAAGVSVAAAAASTVAASASASAGVTNAAGAAGVTGAASMTSATGAAGATGLASATGAVKAFGLAKLLVLALTVGAATTAAVVTRPSTPSLAAATPVASPVALAEDTVTAPVTPPAIPADLVAPIPTMPVAELPSAVGAAAGNDHASPPVRPTRSAEPAASPDARRALDTTPPTAANGREPDVAFTSDADPLAAEARLLEASRACLARGDRACAEARLAVHREQFARGALTDEASILAVDVAIAKGQRATARSLARALVERRPNAALPERIRRLAESTKEEP